MREQDRRGRFEEHGVPGPRDDPRRPPDVEDDDAVPTDMEDDAEIPGQGGQERKP